MVRELFRLAAPVAALLAGVAVRAQNLVPNPGFESYRTCPTADFQFDDYVEHWRSATVGGSPDYFNACNTDLCSQGVPRARYGYQSPRDSARGGRAYAGIYCTNIGVNYREYCATKLTATLEKGRWYRVRFFASLAGASPVGIMNLGAYIGRDPVVAASYVYPASPQIVNPGFLTASDRWTEITGMYQARGDENHIIIGCFDQKLLTTPANTHGACSELRYQGAYYYIDDVSITPAETPSCFSGSEYYDVKFKPAGASGGVCAWDVILSSRTGACPLYGVNAVLPSGTTPFSWRTDSPVMPGETRTVGRFALDESVDMREIFAAYLDAAGAPMSGTTRELRCGTPADALAARAESLDGGSADFCAYDLYIDNKGDMGVQLEELALGIAGGEFQEMIGMEWSVHGTPEPGEIRWRAGSGAATIPPGATLHVGRFSVGASGAPSVTAAFYQHPSEPGGAVKTEPLALQPCSQKFRISGVRVEGAGAGMLDIAPNPAPNGTTIAYRMERAGEMRMELFDLSGTLVATIAEGFTERGEHTLRCDTRGLPNGIYRLRMQSSGSAALATLVVAR